MDELIKKLQDIVGLSQEDATKTVATVIEFIKEKLPAGFGDQIAGMFKNGFDLGGLMGGLTGDNNDPLSKLRNLKP